MTTPTDLSDKALAVFAFAIFHQLECGDVISAIAASDSAGHRVDPEAVAELKARELADLIDDKVVFTPRWRSYGQPDAGPIARTLVSIGKHATLSGPHR